MSETITAIYEQGILRPLLPLSIPEHTRVQIQIVIPAKDAKRQVRQALLDAGIIQPHSPTEVIPPVSEKQLAATANALAMAGPLSDLIIEEREAR